jgi:hypothetical protein
MEHTFAENDECISNDKSLRQGAESEPVDESESEGRIGGIEMR